MHNKIWKLSSEVVAKQNKIWKRPSSSGPFAIFRSWLKSLTVLEFSWRFKNCHDFEADLKTYSHTVGFLKSQVQKLNQLLCIISGLNNCDSSMLHTVCWLQLASVLKKYFEVRPLKETILGHSAVICYSGFEEF